MTPNDVRRVVEEIEAYGRAEREATLTWARIVAFAGFSQVALWKKSAIKDAFKRAKGAAKASATPVIKARAIPEQITRLEAISRNNESKSGLTTSFGLSTNIMCIAWV